MFLNVYLNWWKAKLYRWVKDIVWLPHKGILRAVVSATTRSHGTRKSRVWLVFRALTSDQRLISFSGHGLWPSGQRSWLMLWRWWRRRRKAGGSQGIRILINQKSVPPAWNHMLNLSRTHCLLITCFNIYTNLNYINSSMHCLKKLLLVSSKLYIFLNLPKSHANYIIQMWHKSLWTDSEPAAPSTGQLPTTAHCRWVSLTAGALATLHLS